MIRILLVLAASLLAVPAAAQETRRDDATYTSALTTRWGRAVTPANVWRSYPRPQMRRRDWLNLNGRWDYAIRKAAEPRPARMDGEILVPFAVESKLSGVARRVGPDDRIWYRRGFTVPAGWRGRDVLLHFGAVDFEAHVWINGAIAGSHRGGSDSFALDVTPYLKPGANELVVQVADPTSSGMQPRGKQILEPGSIWYTAVSGIWQTVWLEPVPKMRIEEVRATPDIDRGTVDVTVVLNRVAEPTNAVRITATAGGKPIATALARANRLVPLAIPKPRLWSPDDPFLYDLKAELVPVADPQATADAAASDKWKVRADFRHTAAEAATYAAATVLGPPSDSVAGYFGMRKVSIGPGPVAGQPAILLNNRPLFQNGTLDQGWWPDGLLTPPSEEAMRSDLVFLKAAGFNMVRKHIKVEPAQFYHEADRLGMLVWQDMPSGIGGEDQFVSPTSQTEAVLPSAVVGEYRAELASMVADLHAFPSIVMWVVNNEGWGQADAAGLADMVKAMDPSRIVNAASGWLDRGDASSDVLDIHSYEEIPLAPPRNPARAIVTGEFGGIGLPVEGRLWRPGKRNWGYQTATGIADFRRRYIVKMTEIGRQMRLLGLSASVYTQTSDVEDEINGLLTYDRATPKLSAEDLHAIHRAALRETTNAGD